MIFTFRKTVHDIDFDHQSNENSTIFIVNVGVLQFFFLEGTCGCFCLLFASFAHEFYYFTTHLAAAEKKAAAEAAKSAPTEDKAAAAADM